MTRWLALAAGVFLVLLIALIAIPSLIPTKTYKSQITQLVEQQTGRTLSIDGDIHLSFLPRLAVSAENVRLSNAEWGREADMMAMERLEVALKLWPLLSGNVELDRFSLIRPVIHLEVNGRGTPNWQFTPPAPSSVASDAAAAPVETGNDGAVAIGDVRLGDVSIEGGRATYRNAQSGATFDLSEIDLRLALASLDSPFTADGSMVWNKEPIELSLWVADPRALTGASRSTAKLAIAARPVELSYEGLIQLLGGVRYAGMGEVTSPSARELAAWVGSPLPDGRGFGAFSVRGTLDGTDTLLKFTNAEASIDGMTAKGALTFDMRGTRPKVAGNLALDRLDANAYLPEEAAEQAAAAAGPADGGAARPDAGWSTAPLDLSGLKAVDADLALTTDEIRFRKLRIDKGAVNLTLSGGALTANLTQLGLYEGRGSGQLQLDGSGRTPRLQVRFDLAGVAAEQLLPDAIDFDRLKGVASLQFDVAGAGGSQQAIMQSLNGRGSVMFRDGAIRGINLANLVRTVLSAATTGWDTGGTRDTDFSELSGSFQIQNGIARNDDLKLLGPLLRVTGKGAVNVGAQTIDYRIVPKLVASLEGQGATDGASGMTVPVIIRGPWSKPSFMPDVAAMAQDPDSVVETIKKLKEGGGKDVLRQLMGVPPQSAETPPAEGTAPTETTPEAPAPDAPAPDSSSDGDTQAPAQPQTPGELLDQLLRR